MHHFAGLSHPSKAWAVWVQVDEKNEDRDATKHYKSSAVKLGKGITHLNTSDISFVLNLGDCIDGNDTEVRYQPIARAGPRWPLLTHGPEEFCFAGQDSGRPGARGWRV